jgi:hypothetical protein
VGANRRHLSLLRSFGSDGSTILPIHTIIEVYRVCDMSLVRVLPSAEDELNVATFHPHPVSRPSPSQQTPPPPSLLPPPFPPPGFIRHMMQSHQARLCHVVVIWQFEAIAFRPHRTERVCAETSTCASDNNSSLHQFWSSSHN